MFGEVFFETEHDAQCFYTNAKPPNISAYKTFDNLCGWLSVLVCFHMFFENTLFIYSLTTSATRESVVACVHGLMVSQLLFAYKAFATVLTIVPYSLMYR